MDMPQDYRELAAWYRTSAELAATRGDRRECFELAELMEELAAAQEERAADAPALPHFA
jgi:TPR repeat protein